MIIENIAKEKIAAVGLASVLESKMNATKGENEKFAFMEMRDKGTAVKVAMAFKKGKAKGFVSVYVHGAKNPSAEYIENAPINLAVYKEARITVDGKAKEYKNVVTAEINRAAYEGYCVRELNELRDTLKTELDPVQKTNITAKMHVIDTMRAVIQPVHDKPVEIVDTAKSK